MVSIILQEDSQTLEEVVVIGYGTQKKVNLTGSVASINSEVIENVPASNLSNALSGRLAGVNITQTAGKPGGGSSDPYVPMVPGTVPPPCTSLMA